MPWKRIIYCSHATVPMDKAVNLAELLGASARNNRRDEITGVLAYAEGIFIQAIEGLPHAVDDLMARLKRDSRHRDLVVLGEDLASDRAFPIWMMESPAMRPERTKLLRRLVEACEGSYGLALAMLLEMINEQKDHRQMA